MQEPLDEEKGIEAVHEAFKNGISYFDTSPYYGDLRAEKVSHSWTGIAQLLHTAHCMSTAPVLYFDIVLQSLHQLALSRLRCSVHIMTWRRCTSCCSVCRCWEEL